MTSSSRDEPGTVRKPIRTISTPSQGPSAIPSRLRQTPVLSVSGQANAQGRPVKTTAESPLSTSRSTVSARKAPRTTKKALAQAEQARREAYARALFDELNEVVFGGGIPASTQLRWSNRLLTTAGKAKWHRSRDGAQTSEIELATKVLDCDERIRNTLSHEMCHLACWIINKNIKESHGNIFKGWAAKVMQVRPDIEVSTRHSYEIAYKFEWKCENCAKVYGRHTKSIRPDECVCGGCRAGRLIPLFETPRRTPQTPTKNFASSQLSASRGRSTSTSNTLIGDVLELNSLFVSEPPLQIVGFASPLSNMVDPSGKNPAQSGSRLTKPQPSSSSILVISSDEDSDVEVLTHGLKTVMIRDGGNM
ncbi:hypothetical protein OBBRIDRAFT_726371 [Obba rivulosa]|uniref:SprT-like domain-containing protein n=1 Tax=Obba rivulosa TaxID=1052685 RepID=A0A8E2B2Z0_9APHY|nr:hypothetical protein OBBRIDRAFT_726371 [Obba rivulosa]